MTLQKKIKCTFIAHSYACPIRVALNHPQQPQGLASAELIRVNLLETQGEELIKQDPLLCTGH